MYLLIAGLAVFIFGHLSLSLCPGIKKTVIERSNATVWRLGFSAVIFFSFFVIIFGWRSTPVTYGYIAPPELRSVTILLMFISIICFVAARGLTNLKRYIRHPQLVGVLIWSIAHLLSNGEVRSMILFGSLGAWAVVQMHLISRREGTWVKPEAVKTKNTLLNTFIGVQIFIVVVICHKYITGISLLPGG